MLDYVLEFELDERRYIRTRGCSRVITFVLKGVFHEKKPIKNVVIKKIEMVFLRRNCSRLIMTFLDTVIKEKCIRENYQPSKPARLYYNMG